MEVFLSNVAGCRRWLRFFFSPGPPQNLTLESVTPWQKCNVFKTQSENFEEETSKQKKHSFSKRFTESSLFKF